MPVCTGMTREIANREFGEPCEQGKMGRGDSQIAPTCSVIPDSERESTVPCYPKNTTARFLLSQEWDCRGRR